MTDPQTRGQRTGGRRILLNALANYASRAANLVISLLLIPFMVGHLGADGYGLWVLIGSVVAFGSLLDLGISNAVTKYISEYRVAGRTHEVPELIGSALWLYCGLGAAVAAACLAGAPFLPHWLGLDETSHETAGYLIILSGLAVGLSIVASLTTAVLHGLQRFDLAGLLATVRFLLFAAGTAVVLLGGGGLLQVALVQIASIVLIQIPAVWWIHRLAPEYRFGLTSPNRRSLGTLVSFSWSLFIINVGILLQSRATEIVIGARLMVGAVTPFALASRLSQIPEMLAEQFVTLVLPVASELHGERDWAQLRVVLVVSIRLTLAVFLSIGLTIAIFAGPILEHWAGEEFKTHAALVWVLVAALAFDTAQWPAALVLQGINRHHVLAVTSIAAGVANVALALALIPPWGLLGAAAAMFVPAMLESLVVVGIACRAVNMKVGHLLTHAVLPAAVPALAMAALLAAMMLGAGVDGPMEIAAGALAAWAVYGAVYLGYPTNSTEQRAATNAAVSVARQLRLG